MPPLSEVNAPAIAPRSIVISPPASTDADPSVTVSDARVTSVRAVKLALSVAPTERTAMPPSALVTARLPLATAMLPPTMRCSANRLAPSVAVMSLKLMASPESIWTKAPSISPSPATFTVDMETSAPASIRLVDATIVSASIVTD